MQPIIPPPTQNENKKGNRYNDYLNCAALNQERHRRRRRGVNKIPKINTEGSERRKKHLPKQRLQRNSFGPVPKTIDGCRHTIIKRDSLRRNNFRQVHLRTPPLPLPHWDNFFVPTRTIPKNSLPSNPPPVTIKPHDHSRHRNFMRRNLPRPR